VKTESGRIARATSPFVDITKVRSHEQFSWESYCRSENRVHCRNSTPCRKAKDIRTRTSSPTAWIAQDQLQ